MSQDCTMRVPFYRHDLGPEELAAITEACSGAILTTGDWACRAEEAISGFTGLPHCVALDSCTAALHLALLALGVGPGDEVITTPMTFAATANAVVMVGARPIFADVSPLDGNIDPASVERAITPRTKALLPVHLYGVLCDMHALRDIADRHGLAIVEDAAHCIEGQRDGYGPGDLGDCVCFSFYATKNICTGEGGMLASNRKDLASRVRLLSCHGVDRTAYDRYCKDYVHWDMPVLGWKYNLDNIRASLVPSQVKRLRSNLALRESVATCYEQRLAGLEGVDFPRVPHGCTSARHMQTCWVAPQWRDKVLKGLQDGGVGVAVNYRAVHLLEYYRKVQGWKAGDFPVAEAIGAATLTLPLYPSLREEEQAHVLTTLAAVLDGLRAGG